MRTFPARSRCSGGRSQSLRAFTLLELLVVVAIIAILMLLAARIFTGGSNTSAGAQLVFDHLSAARQHAITKGKLTALAIRTGTVGSGEGEPWARLAIFEVQQPGGEWVRVSPWRNMPRRAYIDSTYDPADEPWTRTPASLPDAHERILAPTPALRDGSNNLTHGTDYQVIAFRPDGGLELGENVALRIVRGGLDESDQVVPDGGSEEPSDWIKLIIENVTGRVKEIRPEDGSETAP